MRAGRWVRMTRCDRFDGVVFFFFFFNDTATTEIYTLSLHDALPIPCCRKRARPCSSPRPCRRRSPSWRSSSSRRSEEHTSELQSRGHLVCRLLLEKKKTISSTCVIGSVFDVSA